jgi:hypothetical protein
VKFRSLLGVALTVCASVFLGSCGGGGAATNGGVEGATLAILPAAGVIYAGVPVTFTVTGGRPPYTLSSSDPTLIAVPTSLNGHSFEVDAPNPSVIDTGIPVGGLPVRTVNLTARDATGQTAAASIQVARNFLTGYGFDFVSTACSTPPPSSGTGGSTAVSPTAGCDTVVEIFATVNGNIQANQTFRFDVVTGNFSFVDPATGNTTNTYTTTTDHNGVATAIIRVPSNAGAQVGVFRITDVQTGVSTTNAFTIGGNSNTTSLTAIPSSFTFTGALTTDCGTGVGDFFVFGGSPPYAAQSSDPNVTVRAVDRNSQPGEFELTANNPGICLTNATIVVTDAVGAHTTVTVTTSPGSTAPPTPAARDAQPTSVTLGCGQSASVTVVGGSGSYSATSTQADVKAIVSGHTVTITRAATDPAGGPFNTSSSVNITDGATIVPISVTSSAATCP